MKHLPSLRWLVPVLSAVAGVCCTQALTCSCSSGCDCQEPRSIVEGEFTNVDVVVPESAPASLHDIDVTKLVIKDGTLVVHYVRSSEQGTATFTFGNMY